MKQFSTALKNALREGFGLTHLVKFKLGDQFFYLTDSDQNVESEDKLYVTGFINRLDDIEQTSEPRTGDINITLAAADNTFVGLLLSKKWMNQPLEIRRVIYNSAGLKVSTVLIFSGLISSFKSNPKQSTISLRVSSIWADFNKRSGVRTNLKSQQRFHSDDEAFRHASDAEKSIPWGKEGNVSQGGGGAGGGGGGSRFDTPQLRR